jgi:hypothetical protein
MDHKHPRMGPERCTDLALTVHVPMADPHEGVSRCAPPNPGPRPVEHPWHMHVIRGPSGEMCRLGTK